MQLKVFQTSEQSRVLLIYIKYCKITTHGLFPYCDEHFTEHWSKNTHQSLLHDAHTPGGPGWVLQWQINTSLSLRFWLQWQRTGQVSLRTVCVCVLESEEVTQNKKKKKKEKKKKKKKKIQWNKRKRTHRGSVSRTGRSIIIENFFVGTDDCYPLKLIWNLLLTRLELNSQPSTPETSHHLIEPSAWWGALTDSRCDGDQTHPKLHCLFTL